MAVTLVAVWLSGCSGAKKVAYIQGAGEEDMTEYLQTTPLYDARIMPKDNHC